jgi:FtsH-binding integral membrane protein
MRPLATQTIAPARAENAYFHRVFAWMGTGLLVTGGVAYAIGRSQRANHFFFEQHSGVIVVLLLLELVLVAALVGLVKHMGLVEAAATYLAYAALNGITISVIFAVYTTASIYSTFLVTAAMFGALALWGYTTNADLTKWGSFLFMALVGQLVGLVVNLIWFNETLYWLTTASGVLIFSALTAYDVQKLKQYEQEAGADEELAKKEAIVGALALYLDFVNLFLYLLRIFGRRK